MSTIESREEYEDALEHLHEIGVDIDMLEDYSRATDETKAMVDAVREYRYEYLGGREADEEYERVSPFYDQAKRFTYRVFWSARHNSLECRCEEFAAVHWPTRPDDHGEAVDGCIWVVAGILADLLPAWGLAPKKQEPGSR